MWRVFLLITVGVFSICPQYTCHTGGYDLGNTCTFVDAKNNVQMQMCDENNLIPYCQVNPQIFQNYTCGQPPAHENPQNYPGERCREDSDCLSGSCYQNVCQGQPLGYPCVSNADCNVGTHCALGSICTKQDVLNAGCSSDYDCQNGLACNRTLYAMGTCLPYYSVPNGDAVGICVGVLSEGNSNLCESGSCMPVNHGTNGEGICQPSFMSIKPYPMTCLQDSDCIASNGATTLIGVCSCGYDMTGKSYCNAWTGDDPAVTVRNIWKQHVSSPGIVNCQTMRRFTPTCLSQTLPPEEISSFTTNNMLAMDTARYQGNDDCTKTIFNGRYWNVNQNSFTCKAYGCDLGASWTLDTCISYQEAFNAFAMRTCPTGQYCNVAQSNANKWNNATCTSAPAPAPAYPGDLCKINSDCISSNCTAGICIGTPAGMACTDDDQCAPGLHCVDDTLDFICSPLIPIGKSGCASEFDCVTNANCNFTRNNFPGTCVAYYSAPVGTPVPCATSGYSNFCESGVCYSNGVSDLGVCANAPKSVKLPTQCQTSNDCTVQNSMNQSFVGTCTCGYNPQGAKYCSAHIGDEPGKLYLTAAKFLYSQTSMSSCQTTRRHYSDCLSQVANKVGQNSDNFYSAALNFTNFPLYIDNDNCVKAIINSDFWSHLPPTPPPGPHDGDDSAGILALGLGLLLAF